MAHSLSKYSIQGEADSQSAQCQDIAQNIECNLAQGTQALLQCEKNELCFVDISTHEFIWSLHHICLAVTFPPHAARHLIALAGDLQHHEHKIGLLAGPFPRIPY